MPASASIICSSVMCPERTSSLKRHRSLVLILLPLCLPVSIGPPDTTILGRFTLHAPITSEGVVLSHPHKSTTPSNGLALMDSSTSILTKLRYSIAVGFISVSPVDITGNSTGNPPASSTPLFTNSASWRKCELQGVSSLQVLQIPMTGLP